ncbi:hypothetical protein [Streptomyces sp. NPDC001642]|uniref:hypothetical protein n=1 Tax=Streptomyces sp. NPDC001642 TaxID=3154392 RepID=UPI00332452C8
MRRLRRLVAGHFTPTRIAALRTRIVEIAADLLAGLPAAGTADLVSGYALRLPVTVICELFGVPEADRTVFRAWSNALVMPASPQTGASAAGALGAYLADLIHRKRGAQEADLLSDLVAYAREPGSESPLTSDELLGMAFLLLVPEHETTVNLISATSSPCSPTPTSSNCSALKRSWSARRWRGHCVTTHPSAQGVGVGG